MSKKGIKVLLITFMVLCLIISGIPASAADYNTGDIVDGSVLTNGDEAEYEENSRSKGTYLASGMGRIANLGGRQVYLSGSTNCHRVSDEVKITLTLQRLEGGSWVYVNSLSPVSAYNTYTVSASGTFSVTGGYYYRVHGSHTAKKGNVSETCSSNSDGIWIP